MTKKIKEIDVQIKEEIEDLTAEEEDTNRKRYCKCCCFKRTRRSRI